MGCRRGVMTCPAQTGFLTSMVKNLMFRQDLDSWQILGMEGTVAAKNAELGLLFERWERYCLDFVGASQRLHPNKYIHKKEVNEASP